MLGATPAELCVLGCAALSDWLGAVASVGLLGVELVGVVLDDGELALVEGRGDVDVVVVDVLGDVPGTVPPEDGAVVVAVVVVGGGVVVVVVGGGAVVVVVGGGVVVVVLGVVVVDPHEQPLGFCGLDGEDGLEGVAGAAAQLPDP